MELFQASAYLCIWFLWFINDITTSVSIVMYFLFLVIFVDMVVIENEIKNDLDPGSISHSDWDKSDTAKREEVRLASK